MNNTTQTPGTPDVGGDGRDWMDIVLPALGVGFLFLICLVFFNYAVKIIKNFKSCCCCGTGLEAQERTTSRGHDNLENVNDDPPPSYSVAGLGRSSVEVFRVIPDDVSDVSFWQRADSEINEKLPSYLEIMEEKQLKAKNSGTGTLDQSSPNPAQSTDSAESPNHHENDDESSIRLPHATIETSHEDEPSESENNEPPPYDTASTGTAL